MESILLTMNMLQLTSILYPESAVTWCPSRHLMFFLECAPSKSSASDKCSMTSSTWSREQWHGALRWLLLMDDNEDLTEPIWPGCERYLQVTMLPSSPGPGSRTYPDDELGFILDTERYPCWQHVELAPPSDDTASNPSLWGQSTQVANSLY